MFCSMTGIHATLRSDVISLWLLSESSAPGTHVEDAQWEEMGNGAMRLAAKLNGQEYKATFSAKSPKGKLAIERGGTKMAQEYLRQFVEDLFLPRYLERKNGTREN